MLNFVKFLLKNLIEESFVLNHHQCVPKNVVSLSKFCFYTKLKIEYYPDCRIISLMTHLLMIFQSVVLGEECETQFGTKEALFGMYVPAQRCRDVTANMYCYSIILQNAFDRVKHSVMIESIRDIGLGGRDVRIVANLYWNQIASDFVDGMDHWR